MNTMQNTELAKKRSARRVKRALCAAVAVAAVEAALVGPAGAQTENLFVETPTLVKPLPLPQFVLVQAPTTLEPARLQENLREGPKILSVPQKLVPLTRKQTAPSDAEATTFVFKQMALDGATRLSQDALLADWPFKSGDVVSVADLFRFANAITQAYSNAGYALSFAVVPEQDIENGSVRIVVIEGFVDKVELVGDRAGQLQGSAILRRAKRIASKVLKSRPLKTADLERYVLLINDLPGLHVSATLTPSSSTTAAATLQLEVTERKPVSGEIAYNNYMPASLDRHVAGATAKLSGVLTGSDEISLSAWHSATSSAYWSASGQGSIGIGNEGLRLGVSGFHSHSDPDDAFLNTLEYLGDTSSGSAYLSYPLIRTRTKNLKVGSSFSVTNTRSEILAAPLTRDRLRDVEISLSYDFADATRAVTYMRAGVRRGLDIFNAGGDSRATGEVQSNIGTVDIQRTQPLMEAFSGEVSAQIGLHGQGTLGPGGLYSSAECAYGGRRFGRAYDAGVLTGEHCALGFGEVRWNGKIGPLDTELYGFGDGGYAWQKGALEPGEIRERNAASAGVGVRLRLTKRVTGTAETSWAVRAPTGATSTDNFRINAGLQVHF